MGVNKVDYNGETLIDLTGDTVTPATLAEGATAHDMAGNPITGTMKQGSDDSSNVFVFDLIFEDGWHFAEGVTYDAIVAAVNSGMVVIGNLIDEAQHSDAFGWGIKTIQFSRFFDEEGTAAIFTGIGIAWMGELPLYMARFVVGEFGMEEVDGERVIRESDLYDYQETSARTTSLSDKSTDQQYPSAKAVYDAVENAKEVIVTLDVDLTTMTASNLSHSYEQITTAVRSGKNVILKASYGYGYLYAPIVSDVPNKIQGVSDQCVSINIFVKKVLDGQAYVIFFQLIIFSNSSTRLYPYFMSTVSMGG